MNPCRHCRRSKPIRIRGLCSTCCNSPAVRALYPAVRPDEDDKGANMTALEVDAMVAAQRLTMPVEKSQRDGERYAGTRYGRAADLIRTKSGRVWRKGQR